MKTVHDCLAGKTAYELTEAMCRLSLDGADGTRGKADMCAALEKALASDPASALLCLDDKMLAPLERAAGRDPIRLRDASADAWLSGGLEELAALGLAWRGRDGWHLTAAAVTMLAGLTDDLREDIRADTEVFCALDGLLLTYGLMTLEELTSLAAPWFDRLSQDDALAVLVAHSGLDALRFQPADGPQTRKLYLCCPEVDEPETLYARLAAPEMRAVPPAPCSLDDALSACDTGLPGKYALYGPALKWLLSRGLDEDGAVDVLAGAVAECENRRDTAEMPALILQDAEILPDSVAPREMAVLRHVAESVPLWWHKGAPAGRRLPAPALKAGRDDPCPCGSGRRYKNCCGRLQ